MTTKRKFSPQKKAAIALAAIKGEQNVSRLSGVYQIHPTQIKRWKKIVEENALELFSDRRNRENKNQIELIDELYKIIGQRETELAWLKKKLSAFDS